MDQNAANAYMRNAVMTASPAQLTLMLYDGAIRFCNIGMMAIDEKDYEKANDNIKRAEAIITELRVTLNRKYSVWEDFDRVYNYIYDRLLTANIEKDKEVLEEGIKRIREMRDTWKEVMRLNHVNEK